MELTVRSLVARYGIAVAAVGVALLVRWAIDPLVGNRLPFLLFCLAVVAVAWHGGFGPSLLALVLGILATSYFFLSPRYSLIESVSEHGILVCGFLFLGVTIGLFSERLRAARWRAEEQAREAIRDRRKLEDEVARRQGLEDELQRRNAELAAADHRKDEFLAMLGHELRNPLGAIRNALHLMRLLHLPDPKLADARDLIERQVDNLSRLVDDLLDVARITRGKIQLRKSPAELGAVVRRAIESARPLIEANRHVLTLALLPEPTRLEVDVTRIEQVFANLLNNAAKYTERGGSIHVIEERDGDAALLRVRDTGFGIPAQVLPHVFDVFMQADRTLDRSQGGLGIGLTLVKTLVELHGGSVTAHSAGPGQGSEFVVRLPITRQTDGQAASPSTPQGSPAPQEAASLRVLVIEDNQDAAASLAMLLRIWGHDVRIAHDGLSGVKAAHGYRPQVVLLDIGLPGMDGYAVARQLRGDLGQAIWLVAMTGYGTEEDRRRALEAGFNAHLVKPADPDALQAVLTHAAALG